MDLGRASRLPSLPDEVWDLVARQLPRRDLLRLATLNRSFYHVVADERYGEILWAKLDDKMLRSLERLQNPEISSRVRRLHVRAWFIHLLIQREALFKESERKLWLANACARLFSLSYEAPPGGPVPYNKQIIRGSPNISLEKRAGGLTSPKDFMRALMTAVSGMVNLVEYSFEWRDLPLTHDTRTFLFMARTTFVSSLRKFTLHAEVSKFSELLSMTGGFRCLEELELGFDSDVLSGAEESIAKANETTFAEFVAPFINQLGPALRKLSIASTAHGDHAYLFDALDALPSLRFLGLHISFDRHHLSSASGICKILCSPALKGVELNPKHDPSTGSTSHPFGPLLSIIMQTCRSDMTVLQHLESLTIPILNQKTTIEIIGRSADTLKSLCVVDRYLSIARVAEVAEFFRERRAKLPTLHVEVNSPKSKRYEIRENHSYSRTSKCGRAANLDPFIIYECSSGWINNQPTAFPAM